MSTDTKRTHGAQPDESQVKPKILTTIRTHAPIDEKTGRAVSGAEGERKVYVEGMEEEAMAELTDDQLATLEAGGFVQGMGVALPSETSLSLDPTVRAGAGRAEKGKITVPKSANISGPRSQTEVTRVATGRAGADADEAPKASKRSGRKGKK